MFSNRLDHLVVFSKNIYTPLLNYILAFREETLCHQNLSGNLLWNVTRAVFRHHLKYFTGSKQEILRQPYNRTPLSKQRQCALWLLRALSTRAWPSRVCRDSDFWLSFATVVISCSCWTSLLLVLRGQNRGYLCQSMVIRHDKMLQGSTRVCLFFSCIFTASDS